MTFRRLLRLVLPPAVAALWRRARRLLRGDEAQRFARGPRIPWSPGYTAYRERLVVRTLEDATLLERFRRDESLPAGYGVGVCERCVEYPWLLSRLPEGPLPLLDAGSALNHDFLLRQPSLAEKEIHIVTLGPEPFCYWRLGVSYLFADLRDVPLRDALYDVVCCVSTLEHVGFDNTIFLADGAEQVRPDDFRLALREMRRLLKPRGRLLLTVPFGRYGNFGTFQQFDAALLDEVAAELAPCTVRRTFYRYTANGWHLAEIDACADAEFEPWIMTLRSERPDHFPLTADRAAAARAVACLDVVVESPTSRH